MGYSMLLRTTLGMSERGDDGLPDDPSKNDPMHVVKETNDNVVITLHYLIQQDCH